MRYGRFLRVLNIDSLLLLCNVQRKLKEESKLKQIRQIVGGGETAPQKLTNNKS